MFKKLLALALVLVGIFTLSACGGETVDPVDELTTLEKISEVMDTLDLPASASSDLTLLTSGLHDVVITWESDNTDVIANDGTVTIPLYTEGDQTVTITAYLTLDDQTLTKEFEVEVLAATEMTDQEKADAAAVAFNGLITGSVTADLTLPTTGQYESTVVWASDNTDVIANDGTVVRPDAETGNVSVTLTGTVTVGDATSTVTLSVTVVAEAGATVYTSIQDMYDNAILDDYIEFTGIVTGLFDGGYFLSDGTLALGIYSPSSELTLAIGDEVKVKGYYAAYNTLYQLGDIASEEVLTTGNANPLDGTAVEKTVAEMLALDSSDPAIHGLYYTVTGTVAIMGDYGNVYLVVGDDALLIYYYSLEASLAALEAQVGKEITITVFYYTDHGTNGPMVAYDGGEAGITVNTLPDDEALAADIDLIDIPAVTLTDVTLPTEGANGTVFSNWASDTTAVLDNDGTFVALGATTTVVTFTATATKGALTDTVTVEVVVPVLSTVAEVNAMEVGSYFQVSGTVYEISYYGFFIEQDGAYIFVYGSDLVDTVEVGENVTMLGNTGVYSGLLQVYPFGDLTSNSTGNADVVTPVVTTVSALENDLVARGTRATVTGTLSREGSYNNVYITDVAGGKVQIYYRSNDEALFTNADNGDLVTITVVAYQDATVLYQLETADVVVETAYTDAYTAQAIADALDLGAVEAVGTDLTLPTTVDTATIAWASDNEAAVATDGTVTLTAGSTTTVTLTATVTVGTEVVTRDIVVTLIDANDTTPINVSDAIADVTGNSLLVTGVVSAIDQYDALIIQDVTTGEGVYLYNGFEGEDIAVGDLVVFRGTFSLYTSNSNNMLRSYNATLIEVTSSDNALVVVTDATAADAANANANMKTYTMDLTVDSYDSYGYVFFTTAADTPLLTMDVDYAPYFEDLYPVGSTLTVTFTVKDVNYGNTRIVPVTLPALTDAQKVAYDKAALEDLSGNVTTDLTLPTEGGNGSTFTWSSDNTAVLANDGTVTRPAEGEADVTVTLTVTLTSGTETDTVSYTIVVLAEVPAPSENVETLDLFPETSSSYVDGSFVGVNSITWTYVQSRGDGSADIIDGAGLMFAKSGAGSLSATISGGVSGISVDFKQPFSTASEIEIYVNGTLVGTSTTSSQSDVQTFIVVGLTVTGDFTLEIVNTNGQCVIDNITWDSYTE